MARGRNWSIEDDEYLMEKWGNASLKTISNKLKRSIKAIKNRAFRLKLGEFYSSGDLLLAKDLLEALGYKDITYILEKFIENGFPIRYVEYDTKRYRKVNIEEFWKWAEKNKDILNFAFFEKNSLGKEPKWVESKRKIDKINLSNKRNYWTKKEERLLIAKSRSGQYTLCALAKDFNRTEQAIRRKLASLGEGINYKARKRVKYTPEEEQKIIEMREKGFDFCIIAKELNRSETGVKDKYNRLVS